MADVRFPDGTSMVARPLSERRPDDPSRDYGLYLDPKWAPSWPATMIDWPDYGLPTDWRQAVEQIERAFRMAQSGRRVEIGCVGGIGRTGTVLACVAVLAGVTSQDAVDWVREHYRPGAVET
ncbi:phosphatase, partial [Candidatus Bipolaricaulota bacterium]|nr:phosphatase [Candidatus Bipolaricaulota bacterium]